MHNELIRWARQLVKSVETGDQDRSAQIKLRDAVRCSYYALFHLLSRQCADFLSALIPMIAVILHGCRPIAVCNTEQ